MKRFPSLLITWSAMAVALVTLLVMSSGTAQAHFFESCASIQVVDTTPGATSDLISAFGVGIGADCIARTADDDPEMYNFGAVINFTPPEWGVAADADLPDGTKVGELHANATLGLLNLGCADKVFPDFEMMDGTTNSGNPIDAKPPGTPDRLEVLSVDGNGNGVIDGAEFFPSFLGPAPMYGEDPLFTADVLAKLRARLFGATEVSGVLVTLNFMIFEPGTALNRENDVPFDIDAALGYPSVTVLNDPTATASNEDAITDFCSPLATDTTLSGTVGANAFRTNPSDGAYNFMLFAASMYDADEDGIENNLDPCPFSPDDGRDAAHPLWDPRFKGPQDPGDRDVDPDFGVPFPDGIPDSCDPYPDIPSIHTSGIGTARTDEDKDGWANRVDNCPLVPNVDQKNSDSDGIGDDCDPNPTVNDGHQHIQCMITTVNIGAGGSAPFTENDMICTEDAVGVDKNGNGVFDSREGGGTGDGDGDGGGDGGGDGDGDGGAEETGAVLSEEVDATQTQLVLTDATPFSVGDFIQVDDEIMEIMAIDGNTLTVKRGVRGTTAAPHTSGADILLLEDDTAVAGETTDAAGGAATGVGSLAPVASSIPAWATIVSALGGAGLLGSLGALAARFIRRRR